MSRRIVTVLLAVIVALAGVAAAAEGYRIDRDSAPGFEALLGDLLSAYETPGGDDAQRLQADLEAIRGVSETDYAVALSVAEHWRRVYLDVNYPLYLYDGGERATALENAGLGEIEAIVVLGYELKNGEMTDELMGRCDAAAAVARSFPGAILVCSGGATGDNNPEGHTEAGLMRDYLVSRHGVDAERVLIDERAMTTVDNAVNTFEILEARGVQSMTVVTSTYHQRWGQAIYNAVGALYAQMSGYAPKIVGNYCYDTEPSDPRFRQDARIAIRQLGAVLGLPRDKR